MIFTVILMCIWVGGEKGCDKDIQSLLKNLLSIMEKYDVCSNT